MKTTMHTLQIKAMNMPFTVKLVHGGLRPLSDDFLQVLQNRIAEFLQSVDRDFSPFRPNSLVSRYQRSELTEADFTSTFQEVYGLATKAKSITAGAFDPFYAGSYDPTGLVKGWAIQRAFERYLRPLLTEGILVAAAINGAGDIQMGVAPGATFTWHVGVEDPQDTQQLIYEFSLQDGAMATSGTSQHGEHIVRLEPQNKLQQVTIIANELIEADILATAAMAMGPTAFKHFSQFYLTAGLMVDEMNQAVML